MVDYKKIIYPLAQFMAVFLTFMNMLWIGLGMTLTIMLEHQLKGLPFLFGFLIYLFISMYLFGIIEKEKRTFN